MSQVLVINSLFLNSWRDIPFSTGKTVQKYLLDYLEHFQDLPMIELLKPGQTGVIEQAEKVFMNPSAEGLVSAFSKIFEKYTRLIFFWSDTPFLDQKLTEKLLEHHDRYLSQYTFADGWPRGLSPEILENRALEKLLILAKGSPVPFDRDILFTLIQKDINAFDLETLISPEDYRLLRLQLAADRKENWILLDRFDREGLINHRIIHEKLVSREELLRTVPAFYQIQITEKKPQIPFYLPQPDFSCKGEMNLNNLVTILDKIESFSAEAVVSLSFWSEPSSHTCPYPLMEQVLTRKGLTLLVETSGLNWNREALQPLIEKYSHKMEWIVELDALDAELYKELRGQGQEEVLSFLDFLGPQLPGRLYVQTTRIMENEDHLESLYQEWKNKPGELIIKKYDHFCGLLPQRKITDLSPIKRNPCWHVKRDMVILLDGTVLTCQECLNSKESPGNVLEDDLEEIWNRGMDLYKKHLEEDYPSLCMECDEYYTYNF